MPGRGFDAWHGVETCGQVAVVDLEIPEEARPQAGHYQPTKLAVFHRVINRLPIADRGMFAFVDFGCGKGRCLLLAARAGFRSVIGVELADPLCVVARSNADRFMKGRFADRISIQCSHSTDAELPGGPTVFYFYNPFGEEAMLSTMRAIRNHLDRTGKEAYAVYVNTMHNEIIAEGGFRPIESGYSRNEPWSIWHRPKP